ncbi:MAG: kynureninase [Terriglobales bacterium]
MMTSVWTQARAWARAQDDAGGPLAAARGQFQLPRGANGGEAVYCCGHSLGPLPRAASEHVRAVLETWGERAVEGHVAGSPSWSAYAEPLARSSARLVGAQPDEVAVMHSLTVNLHLMLASFYRPTPARHCILIERPAFPSDRYAVASQLQWHGYDPAAALLEVGARPGEAALRPEDLLAQIEAAGPRLALVLLGGVNYYTGQAFDLAAVARAAHAAGALAGFDLAHAVGNIPLALHDADADFAIWCGYKYLNGGPGAPAAAFVHQRHFSGPAPRPRLAGWWGNRADTRFEMRPGFEPEHGAAGWVLSCPSILALAGLKAGLEIFDSVPLEAWQAKARALSAGFERWASELLPQVRRITPAVPEQRGAQWSLDLGARAATVHDSLRQAGIYSDVRGPILRLAFHPLYNRFQDVAAALEALDRAIA